MNISSNFLTRQKLNFTSQPIQNVNLRRPIGTQSYEYIPATITRLYPDDAADAQVISDLEESWDGTKYGHDIAKFFKNDARIVQARGQEAARRAYYAIEN